MQTVRRASGDIHLTFHYKTSLNNTVWIRRTKINPSKQRTCPKRKTKGYDFYIMGCSVHLPFLKFWNKYIIVVFTFCHLLSTFRCLAFYRHCIFSIFLLTLYFHFLLLFFTFMSCGTSTPATCPFFSHMSNICISYRVVLYSHTTFYGRTLPFSAYSMYRQVRDVHGGIMMAVTQT